jgi:hypothetical protein
MGKGKKIGACLAAMCVAAGFVVLVHGVRSAYSCSGFTAHDSETVLVGQNEDYYAVGETAYDTRTLVRFVPGENGNYGVMLWGFAFAFPQGGMNDQGLFYDGFATPEHTVDSTGTLAPTETMTIEMMQNSATVYEAVDFLQMYDLTQVFPYAQVFFADRYGDSVVFDGTHVDDATGDYQVVTNFLFHEPELGNYPCWRYDLMTDMMENGLELTVDYFASIGEAVHQGNFNTPLYTRYTTIGELKEGVVHLYYDLDYSKVMTFVLEDELAKGEQEYWMEDIYDAIEDPDAGVVDAEVFEDGGGSGEDAMVGDGGTGTEVDAGEAEGDGGGDGGCGSCAVGRKGSATGKGEGEGGRGFLLLVLMLVGLSFWRRGH